MPVSGPKPKPEGQRRHRVKPAFDWVEVPDRPFTDAPDLPARPDGKPWLKRTEAWWSAISTMPHCVLWTDSDWSYAIDAALVAAALHAGDLRAAAPLERREKVMGTTVDYRRDIRVRYVTDEVDEPVVEMESYRDRLTRSSA